MTIKYFSFFYILMRTVHIVGLQDDSLVTFNFKKERVKLSDRTRDRLIEFGKERLDPNPQIQLKELETNKQIFENLKVLRDNAQDLPADFCEVFDSLKQKFYSDRKGLMPFEPDPNSFIKLNRLLFSEYHQLNSSIKSFSIKKRLKKIRKKGDNLYSAISTSLKSIEQDSTAEYLFQNLSKLLRSISDNSNQSSKLLKEYQILCTVYNYNKLSSEKKILPNFPLYQFDQKKLQAIPLKLLKLNNEFISSYKNLIDLLSNDTIERIFFITNFYVGLDSISRAYSLLSLFFSETKDNLVDCFRTITPKCDEIIAKSRNKITELNKEFFEKLDQIPRKRFGEPGIFTGPVTFGTYSEIRPYKGLEFILEKPFLTMTLDDQKIPLTNMHVVHFSGKKTSRNNLVPIDDNYLVLFSMDSSLRLTIFHESTNRIYFYVNTKNGLLYTRKDDNTFSLVSQLKFFYEGQKTGSKLSKSKCPSNPHIEY